MPAPPGRKRADTDQAQARTRTKTRSEPELKHGAKQKLERGARPELLQREAMAEQCKSRARRNLS
jgi:hypothetical protein